MTVAKSTEYPSKLLLTMGAACNMLANRGLDVASFFQKIIDDPLFRDRVARLLVRPTLMADEVVPEHPHSGGSIALVCQAFGYTGEFRLSRAEARDFVYYTSREGLCELMADVCPQDAEALVLRYGLRDGQRKTVAEISRHLDCSELTTHRLMDRGTSAMYRAAKTMEATKVAQSGGDVPIELLGLSIRVLSCLTRASVSTLELLSTKSEDDLLMITRFDQSCVDEIKAKLTSLGRSLAQ